MNSSSIKKRHDAVYRDYRMTKEGYRALIVHGLGKLGEDFRAKFCTSCDGTGEVRSMYTAGCGGGYYMAADACSLCNGTGLHYGGSPVPDTVVIQVLNTGYYDGIANGESHNPPWVDN